MQSAYGQSDFKACQTRAQLSVKKEQGLRLGNSIDNLQIPLDQWGELATLAVLS